MFLLPLLRLVGYLFFETADDLHLYDIHVAMDKVGLFFYPLQGFFNCLIFLSFKVYNYRRFSNETSNCSTLRLMFSSSAQDPAFISRISIVKMNEEEYEKKSVDDDCYNIDISDELDDERKFRLGLLNNDNSPLPENTLLPSDQGTGHYEVSPHNNAKRKEMISRLGLIHASKPLDAVDEEASGESNSQQIQIGGIKNASSVEILSSSSGSDAYQYYHGVLEDSRKIQEQIREQTKDFVSSFLSDKKSSDKTTQDE